MSQLLMSRFKASHVTPIEVASPYAYATDRSSLIQEMSIAPGASGGPSTLLRVVFAGARLIGRKLPRTHKGRLTPEVVPPARDGAAEHHPLSCEEAGLVVAIHARTHARTKSCCLLRCPLPCSGI